MLRNILGAIAGYIAMVVVAIGGIGIAWLILGGEGAFAGEGPQPSVPWLGFNLVFGFLSAMVGGFVALKIGRSNTATKILIGLLLVLGLLIAISQQFSAEEKVPIDKPVAEMSFTEAGQHAVQPAWYNWVIPLIGAAGAWLGGRDKSRSGTA